MTGRIISHYELEALLGEGAMGRVYRARDTILERRVALKLVGSSSPSDPAFMERFLREARLAAHLNHPNIATIYEFGIDQGEAFLVMELVDGHTLAELTGPRDAADVRRWGAQAASALSAAHAQGIVHRDIKPGNLMVTRQGYLKVMDFGIAHRAGDVHLTTEGKLVGTPKTMAPEILRGQESGPPADLFSLGCVLYEALTGRAPFAGEDSMVVLYQIAQEDPPPVAKLRPDAPADLVRVIQGLLVKDPAQRFGPAATVAAALAGDFYAVPASPPSAGSDETVALSSNDVARSMSALSDPGRRTPRATDPPATPGMQDIGTPEAAPRPATFWRAAKGARKPRSVRLWMAAAIVLAIATSWWALQQGGRDRSNRTRALRDTKQGADLMRRLEARGFESASPESIHMASLFFESATRADPKFAMPWFHLGKLSVRTGNDAAAASEFQEALHDSVTFAAAHLELGSVYERLGRNAEAESEYRVAMEQDSMRVEAPAKLAALLASQGRATDALEILGPALARWPQSAALWKSYGRTFPGMGLDGGSDSLPGRGFDSEEPAVQAARRTVALERARIQRDMQHMLRQASPGDTAALSEALRQLHGRGSGLEGGLLTPLPPTPPAPHPDGPPRLPPTQRESKKPPPATNPASR